MNISILRMMKRRRGEGFDGVMNRNHNLFECQKNGCMVCIILNTHICLGCFDNLGKWKFVSFIILSLKIVDSILSWEVGRC